MVIFPINLYVYLYEESILPRMGGLPSKIRYCHAPGSILCPFDSQVMVSKFKTYIKPPLELGTFKIYRTILFHVTL